MTTTTRPHRLFLFLRRNIRRALALCIASVAAVWSFDTLTNLAQYIGFGHLSWMFPICVDAVAALGMDYWMTKSPAWRAGRVMALFAIGVSLVGNPVDWLLREGNWLAAGFGMIPPAALAAVLGITHRNARGMEELAEQQRAAELAAQEEAEKAEAKRLDREARRVVKPRKAREIEPAKPRLLPAKDDAARLAQLRQLAEQTGSVPTKREVMSTFGVGSDKALKLTRTIRETTETAEFTTDGEAS